MRDREYIAFEDGIHGINAYPTFGEPQKLLRTLGPDVRNPRIVVASSKTDAIRQYRSGTPTGRY